MTIRAGAILAATLAGGPARGGLAMTIRAGAILAATLAGGPLAAQEVTLPSGHRATLFDVILEASTGPTAPDAFTDPEGAEGEASLADLGGEPPEAGPADPPRAAPPGAAEGGLARFRLVVPGLGGEGAGFEAVARDFAWVCAELALPALSANGLAPAEVVVTLSDRETAFGVLDAQALQFFEGFRISEGACVPQAF